MICKCDECKREKETVLFKGFHLCIDCLKDARFKSDTENAREKSIISDKELNKKLSEIIQFFGEKNQMYQAVQELVELVKEITEKLITGNTPVNMISEIADVEIMLKQLKMILAIPDYDLILEKQSKIERTLERIKDDRQ